MDIGKSVSYIFEDEEWAGKVGVGALIMLVPVLNFVGIGYEAQVIRNVSRGQARPLPAWNDFGAFFMDGLWLALARLVYALPIFALLCLPLTSFFLLLFTTAQDERRFNTFFPFVILFCGLMFLILLLYSLTIGLLSPAVTAQYIRRGTFTACFDVPAILRFIRDNFSNYLTVWLGSLAVGLALNIIVSPVAVFLSFIPCIGQLAYLALLGGMVIVTLLVTGHLVGQLIRAADARTGALTPAPIA